VVEDEPDLLICRRLRGDPVAGDVPIIMVKAKGEESDSARDDRVRE